MKDNKLGIMPISKLIWNMSLPIIVSMLVQALYNIVDSVFVSQVSEQALTAVTLAFPAQNLMIGLATGTAVGVNALLGRALGAGDGKRADQVAINGIFLAVVGFVLSAVLALCFGGTFFRTQTDIDYIVDNGITYLRICCCASLGLFCEIMFERLLQGTGRSILSMYTQGLGAIVNIVLDPIFIFVFKMGVAGVATATVISNFFSACMILYFLTHEEEMLRLDFRKLRIRWEYLLGIIKIGLPAGLQSMVFSLSNVVIQAAINSFGSDGIAGSTAEQNFEFMAYFVINAFAQTATTFTSQNFAAQDKERCKKIYRLCTFIGLASCLGLSLIFLIGRHLFIQIFSTDENVIHYAMIRMWSVCLLELLTGVYEISGGCLRGMGHSMTPAVITVLGTCVFRLVWVNTIYAAHRSYLMLMIVYPVSWVITGTAVTVAYFIIRRKEFAQIGKRRADII